MFADDVAAFLRNTRSLEAVFHTADLFSKCSGLEINSEKTECMVLGNHVSSRDSRSCHLLQKHGHVSKF